MSKSKSIIPSGDAAKATRNILSEAIVALERMQWQHQHLHAENGRLRAENDRLRQERHSSASTKTTSKRRKIE